VWQSPEAMGGLHSPTPRCPQGFYQKRSLPIRGCENLFVLMLAEKQCALTGESLPLKTCQDGERFEELIRHLAGARLSCLGKGMNALSSDEQGVLVHS
jgi:hypothetical protein